MKCEIFDAQCNTTEIIEDVLEFLDPLEGEIPAVDNFPKIEVLTAERLRAENAIHPAAISLQSAQQRFCTISDFDKSAAQISTSS